MILSNLYLTCQNHCGGLLDRFIDYIQFLNDSSYLSAEITRLQALKKSRTNLAKRLMAMVLYRLETSQVKKIETPKHKITVVGKGGKQPIEIDYDEVEDREHPTFAVSKNA